jgi:hypothetical protein
MGERPNGGTAGRAASVGGPMPVEAIPSPYQVRLAPSGIAPEERGEGRQGYVATAEVGFRCRSGGLRERLLIFVVPPSAGMLELRGDEPIKVHVAFFGSEIY